MTINKNDIISWDEIKTHYPNEWVVLANPLFDGMNIVEGIVIAHHFDKRVASIEGGEKRGNFLKFTLCFTGEIRAQQHIGILIKPTSPKTYIPSTFYMSHLALKL